MVSARGNLLPVRAGPHLYWRCLTGGIAKSKLTVAIIPPRPQRPIGLYRRGMAVSRRNLLPIGIVKIIAFRISIIFSLAFCKGNNIARNGLHIQKFIITHIGHIRAVALLVQNHHLVACRKTSRRRGTRKGCSISGKRDNVI